MPASARRETMPELGNEMDLNYMPIKGDTEHCWPGETPSCWEAWDEFKKTYTPKDKVAAWTKTDDLVKTYSEEMIDRWNTEIDTLLVYAGLFSAILTAFNVQSYQLLQPPDPTLAVMQQISAQLSSFSMTTTSINSTQPAFTMTPEFAQPSGGPTRSVVALNILWFSALVCSLAAAANGIAIKQWTHEFRTGLSGTSRETARLRQYRLNNLVKWRVADLVALLPILLQAALALFFAGLLVLLWILNETVAIFVSVLVCIVLTFILGSSLLPVIWKDCCYLSPLTYIVFAATERFKRLIRHIFYQVSGWPVIRRYLHRGLGDRGGLTLDSTKSTISWQGREKLIISSSHLRLDADSIVTAYTATMDVHYLDACTALLCDCPPPLVIDTYDRVNSVNIANYGRPAVSVTATPPDFWLAILLNVLQTPHDTTIPSSSTHRMHDIRRYILVSLSFYDPHPSRFTRQLLALSAARVQCGVQYHRPLYSCARDMLRHATDVPPDIIRRVVAAMECSIREHLDNDRETSEWNNSTGLSFTLQAIRVILRCYIAYSPTYPPEDAAAFRACTSRTLSTLARILSSLTAAECVNRGIGYFISTILRQLSDDMAVTTELVTEELLATIEGCIARVRACESEHGMSILFVDDQDRLEMEAIRCRQLLSERVAHVGGPNDEAHSLRGDQI